MKRLLLPFVLLAISSGFVAAQKTDQTAKVDNCEERVLSRLPTDMLQGTLLIAIYENDADCVRKIFETTRLNPNFKWVGKNENSIVPIILTIDYGGLEILNELFKAGLNVKSEEAKQALFSAIKSVQIGKLKALLEGGAGVHLKDKDGQTAFSLAEKIEDSEKRIVIVDLLKKYSGE
jgi:ankyrin repeat protein